MEKTDFINDGYEIVFESANIYYIKLSERLVDDYLTMVNDINIADKISHNPRTYTYEQEMDWVRAKLEEKGGNEKCMNWCRSMRNAIT